MAAAGCVSAGMRAERVGSAVGAAAGAAVGYQYGQAGLGKSVGSGLGGAAGSVADASREHPPAAAQLPKPAPAAPSKFCPIGGERYPAPMKYCPVHGAELKAMTDGAAASGGSL